MSLRELIQISTQIYRDELELDRLYLLRLGDLERDRLRGGDLLRGGLRLLYLGGDCRQRGGGPLLIGLRLIGGLFMGRGARTVAAVISCPSI